MSENDSVVGLKSHVVPIAQVSRTIRSLGLMAFAISIAANLLGYVIGYRRGVEAAAGSSLVTPAGLKCKLEESGTDALVTCSPMPLRSKLEAYYADDDETLRVRFPAGGDRAGVTAELMQELK